MAVQAFFDAHAPKDDQERLFPMGIQDAFALEKWDWLCVIEQGRKRKPVAKKGCEIWRRRLRCANPSSPVVPSKSPKCWTAQWMPTNALLTLITGSSESMRG
ncbi:MAG: hypothetical protein SLRJCFUN_001760 [Candidatus Fervidibacter sp.]